MGETRVFFFSELLLKHRNTFDNNKRYRVDWGYSERFFEN